MREFKCSTNAQVRNGGWKHLAQDDKEKLIKCGCCCGGVQDMEHVLTDCGMTEDAVEAALTSIAEPCLYDAYRGKGTS